MRADCLRNPKSMVAGDGTADRRVAGSFIERPTGADRELEQRCLRRLAAAQEVIGRDRCPLAKPMLRRQNRIDDRPIVTGGLTVGFVANRS